MQLGRILRHFRDRVADALFVLIAGIPWVGDAMQRALDRRRDERTDRRLAALEDQHKPKTWHEQRRLERIEDAERRRRDRTARYAESHGRRGGKII